MPFNSFGVVPQPFGIHPTTRSGPPHGEVRSTLPASQARPVGRSREQRPTVSRSLAVENIPRSALSTSAVESFFAAFGRLVDVSVDPMKARAVITYTTVEEANRAISSPAAVFDNRFVRVYRAREEDRVTSHAGELAGPAQSTSALPSTVVPIRPAKRVYVRRPTAQQQAASDRAAALQRNATRQKELMTSLEAVEQDDKDQRRAIMQDLRRLAREADQIRDKDPSAEVPSNGNDPTEQLARLRQEVSLSCVSVRRLTKTS